MDWSIIAASAGFAGAYGVLEEYRLWKSRRTEIPLGWSKRKQAFIPDLKLKRIERAGIALAWTAYLGMIVIGIMVVKSY